MAALSQLWGMRTPLDLVGTSIDAPRAQWNNRLGGTGAGADSFYEYLLKAYLLFGKSDHLPAASALGPGLVDHSGEHLKGQCRVSCCPCFLPSPHVQLLPSLSSVCRRKATPVPPPFPLCLHSISRPMPLSRPMHSVTVTEDQFCHFDVVTFCNCTVAKPQGLIGQHAFMTHVNCTNLGPLKRWCCA